MPASRTHGLRSAGQVAKRVRKRPVLDASSLLASPRAWLMATPGESASHRTTAGLTNGLSPADGGIAPPVSACMTNVRARGPEGGVASCLRLSDGTDRERQFHMGSDVAHTKANVFALLRGWGLQGGNLISTFVHSKDPHPSNASQQQPTTEADLFAVRPWAPATLDTDVAFTGARKVGRCVSNSEPLEEVADDSDTRSCRPAMDDADSAVISLDENAPSDSGVADAPTPELCFQQRGGEIAGPTSETKWGNNRSYRLFGGRFLDGHRAHQKTGDRKQHE